MLFGKRRSKSLQEAAAESLNLRAGNRREHYRVRPGAKDRIRACLERESGSSIQGDCIELSIGGAGVEFDPAGDPRLDVGDLCSLKISTDSHPESVKATCRVAAVLPLDDGGLRVCFHFTDRIELFAQLDEFYARLFNRRRHVRDSSNREMRTPVRLEWNGGSLSGIAHDLSESGLGMTVPLHMARVLPKTAAVVVTFRLPRQRVDIVCRAAIRSRTRFANSCLVGIEFLPEGGIEEHLAAMRRHIEERLAALLDWNASSTQRKAG